jgi:hypothetical protein
VARIRVVVRKRPINKKELARREEDVVWIDEAGTALQVRMLGVDVNLEIFYGRICSESSIIIILTDVQSAAVPNRDGSDVVIIDAAENVRSTHAHVVMD